MKGIEMMYIYNPSVAAGSYVTLSRKDYRHSVCLSSFSVLMNMPIPVQNRGAIKLLGLYFKY
jgi:hypothetical protein